MMMTRIANVSLHWPPAVSATQMQLIQTLSAPLMRGSHHNHYDDGCDDDDDVCDDFHDVLLLIMMRIMFGGVSLRAGASSARNRQTPVSASLDGMRLQLMQL